jgi:tetratricopeptide (TPR) repeat protein
MNRIFTLLAVMCVFAVAPLMGDDGSDSKVVIDSFLKNISELKLEDEKKDSAEKIVEELRDDSPADTITEALMALYPEYSDAIEASDNDDLASAKTSLQPFSDSEDKFLASDASFYLARTLMNHEEFESALPLLTQLTGDLGDFTVHSGIAQYYIGVAEAGMLNNQKAIEAFASFLQHNPTAPERLRVSAWRQFQQLQAIQKGKLDDVSQRMDFSRRRLTIEESNDVTQEEQEKIVKMLNQLIKEAEKKEAQSSCKNCQSQSEQQQQQQPGQSQGKPSDSKSNKGGTSSKSNGSFKEKSFDNGSSSPWSQLRDRARDPANTAAKEKLPARYRDLVERYFEESNKYGDNR